MITRCLPPRIALEVLRGTRGNKELFLHLATAVNMAGTLAAMNLEAARLEEIRRAQQTVARSFLAANNTGIWAIHLDEFEPLKACLEIYDQQLARASLSAVLAAEFCLAERMRLTREANESKRKAA